MLIFTGRFQPFHNGHLFIIEYLKKNYPDENICIAVIKDYPFKNRKTEFDKIVDAEISKGNAFLDSESTLYLINSVIRNRNFDNVFTTLMPRASDESWPVINELFDCNRIWVFTRDELKIDNWEKIKSDYYASKGEKVIYIPINKSLGASQIRKCISNEDFTSLEEYVPQEVIDYYKRTLA